MNSNRFLHADVPVLKSHWERFKVHFDLDMTTAGKLLSPYTTDRIEQVTVLSDGCANSNFKITFSEHHAMPVLLRIYMRDKSALTREIKLHAFLKDHLPVANIIYHDASCSLIPYPYSIMGWMNGTLMRDVILDNDRQAISECAREAGAKLAILREMKFAKGGFFQDDFSIRPFSQDEEYGPYIYSLLDESRVADGLEIELLGKVKKLIAANLKYLPDKNDANMTHGDYDPANILVDLQDGKWKISAILDWEFALSSTYLLDIGLFLRYSRRLPDCYATSFVAGIESNGKKLPPDWEKAARLMDLLCLLQLLYYNPVEQRPNLNRDVLSLINDIV